MAPPEPQPTAFLLREAGSPDQGALQVITNAIHAALEYSPVMDTPRDHDDVYAFVSREIERRFWEDIYVERPEIREILYTLETGQLVLITGERGTGKSTAIRAVVDGHEPAPEGTGGGFPDFIACVFDANRATEKLRDAAHVSPTLHRQLYEGMLCKVKERLDRDAGDHDAWRAYLYEHDRAFELFQKRVERDQICGQSPEDWLYLAAEDDYAELIAEGEREHKGSDPVDRLASLLTFIGARTAYEPLIIIDNVDHLGHDVALRCCEVLHSMMSSSSHRVRAAVAVRPETADAIERKLDTGVRPAVVPMTRRPLTPHESEKPPTEITLNFLERRLKVVQQPEVMHVVRSAIDRDAAERLASDAKLTDDGDVAVYLNAVMELLKLIFYDLFRPDERDTKLRQENRDFAGAVHRWHNGSLRDCGLSLTLFASDILQGRNHVYRLHELLRTVYGSQERHSVHRRKAVRRVARTLLYRHLLFWAANEQEPMKPPHNVMVFAASEEATEPPIHFLRMRILQYLAKRERRQSTVANVRSDLARLSVPAERVDQALEELADKRSVDDAGLVRIDGFYGGGSGEGLGDGAVVRLLEAGRFLIETLYTTTEYLFWSAIASDEAADAIGLPKALTYEDIQSDSFRTKVASRFLSRHLVEKLSDEHPFLRGFTGEWKQTTARRHLRKYEDLFGFSRGTWFLTRAEKSIRAFIPNTEATEWADARASLDEVRRVAQWLDGVMDASGSGAALRP